MLNVLMPRRFASVVPASSITSVRRRCSLIARPNLNKITSSGPCALNWAKSRHRRFASACCFYSDKVTNHWPKDSPKDNIKTRKVSFLVADGVDNAAVSPMKQALLTAGAAVMTVAPRLGQLNGSNGEQIKADLSLLTGSSVLFDAVYIPGGEASIAALKKEPDAAAFIHEAHTHCKTIAANGNGAGFLRDVLADKQGDGAGLILDDEGPVSKTSQSLINEMAKHRHWDREESLK